MFLPFIVFDAISAFFICIASLWIRFDFSVTKLLENVAYLDKAIKFSPVYVISLLLICFIFKLYQRFGNTLDF